MNKKLRILSIALLAMFGGLLPGAAKQHTVNIEQGGFSPASLSITVGDRVTWNNRGDSEHVIAADDKTFESPKLGAGASFSHTFTKTGTHSYGCRFHPREKGTITVLPE